MNKTIITAALIATVAAPAFAGEPCRVWFKDTPNPKAFCYVKDENGQTVDRIRMTPAEAAMIVQDRVSRGYYVQRQQAADAARAAHMASADATS